MFSRIAVTVELGPPLVFKFGAPISVKWFIVHHPASEKTLWEFIADEFKPITVLGASFHYYPIAEAPPALLAAIESTRASVEHELEQRGLQKPPLQAIAYGVLPPGYREKQIATDLPPGDYLLIAFAAQGSINHRFSIPSR